MESVVVIVIASVIATGLCQSEVPRACMDDECCDTRVAKFDLSTGKSTLGPEGIELSRPIKSLGSAKDNCAMGGQLKINFEALSQRPCNVCMDEPQYGRRMLKLEFFFAPNNYRNGWMFNIGDSVTNNGYGGDSGTQLWDAEIDGIHPDLNLFSNDVCKFESGVDNLWHKISSVLGEGVDKLTMHIANGFIRVVAGHVDTRMCSRCLFATNRQADSGGVNTDIYVGLNSVVSGSGGRVGRGLCKVKASWVCPLKTY